MTGSFYIFTCECQRPMQSILHHIRKTVREDFYRNIAGLFSGIFMARVIPALFAILIARLYAPANFGEYMLYLSIATLLSVFVNGGYEGAVIIAGHESRRRRLVSFTLKMNLFINLIIVAVVLFFNLAFRKNESWNLLMVLIPFYAFFFGATQMVRNLLISRRSFRKLAFLEVVRALLTGILQSLCFVFPETGLFIGVVTAQVITFFWFSESRISLTGFLSGRMSLFEKALARRYRNFPLFSLPSEFFNYLSQQLPVFLIKPFFGSLNLGLYSFSHRYLSVPVQLTGISIGSVYVERASSLKKSPVDLADLTFSLFRKQVWISLIPFTVIALWGGPLFGFIFGKTWEYSGYLAQILSPWLFFVFISSPLSTVLIAREKQRESMIFNILLLLMRAFVLVAGGMVLNNLSLTILLFSMTGMLFFLFLGAYSLHLAHVSLPKAGLFLLKTFCICSLPLILTWLWIQ